MNGNIFTLLLVKRNEFIELVDLQEERYDSLVLPLTREGQIIGYISASISQTVTTQKIQETVGTLAFIGGLILIVVAVLSYFLVVGITRPIVKAAALLEDIASGEGDLIQRLHIHSHDEMGILAKWFNKFVEKVQQMMQDIQIHVNTVATSSEELSANSQEMLQTSHSMSQAITEEAVALQQSSETISTMIQSMESMFGKITTIQAMSHQAEAVAIHGNEVVDMTGISMENIEKSTKKIEGVVEVITGIANQTNLLSLNAAIEAVKAGDAGKGFAVVANEVRNLAEKSSHSVVEIHQLVEESRTNVEQGAKVIHETQGVLSQIIGQVQEMTQYLNELSLVISDQKQAIRDVSNGVDSFSELSKNNTIGVTEMVHALNESATTADRLSGLADDLMAQVNRFKV